MSRHPTNPAARSSPPPPSHVPDDKKATEHLANERTFLVWVRTSIAIVSLGFVVAKFGLWLERIAQLSPGFSGPSRQPHPSGWSMPIGTGMMITGALLVILAGWHHRRVSRDIEAGKVEPAIRLVLFVSVLVAALAAVMVAYLLVSAR